MCFDKGLGARKTQRIRIQVSILAPTMYPVTSKFILMNLPCGTDKRKYYIANHIFKYIYFFNKTELHYLQTKAAYSQIWKSCRSWWSWHFQRPRGWGWPAAAAFPTPPGDKGNMNRHQPCTVLVPDSSLPQVVTGWWFSRGKGCRNLTLAGVYWTTTKLPKW